MHYPQLPDETGWDIDMTNYTLADDWKCSETGLVDDIHFWYSVEDDIGTQPFQPPYFTQVKVSIHDNVPAGTGDVDFSHPGELLRSWEFDVTASMLSGPFPGNQGWDDPVPLTNSRPNDHIWYWQLNITDISTQVSDPFTQRVGEIYWLDLNVVVPTGPLVGWKTTEGIYEDAAVYQTPGGVPGWAPTAVCTANLPTDLAFVITPEPATLVVLTLGLIPVLLRRRR